mmetsp:Transcript_13772/g.43229  ORF Transcript_13772/g.43229 Transcript_13772/m.43229 type:complete len:209 (-) Transcript_13772:244-870(-)
MALPSRGKSRPLAVSPNRPVCPLKMHRPFGRTNHTSRKRTAWSPYVSAKSFSCPLYDTKVTPLEESSILSLKASALLSSASLKAATRTPCALYGITAAARSWSSFRAFGLPHGMFATMVNLTPPPVAINSLPVRYLTAELTCLTTAARSAAPSPPSVTVRGVTRAVPLFTQRTMSRCLRATVVHRELLPSGFLPMYTEASASAAPYSS